MNHKRGAFTIVELLVVITIIGVLIALLLPAVQAAREAARRTSCFNNMKQVGIALHHYHDVHDSLPPGWMGLDPATGRPWSEGQPGWGWASKILPFLEQENVSNNLIRDILPITDPANDQARDYYFKTYRCPSDVGGAHFDLGTPGTPSVFLARLAVANYVGMFGTSPLQSCENLPVGVTCTSDGVFYHLSRTRFADITDGLSNTFIAGERSSRIEHSTWVGVIPGADEAFARILGVADHPPNTAGIHLDDFSSQHPAGTNFLLGDGSVRLISETIDQTVYRAFATYGGNEPAALE